MSDIKILRESGPGIYEVEIDGKLDYVYKEDFHKDRFMDRVKRCGPLPHGLLMVGDLYHDITRD